MNLLEIARRRKNNIEERICRSFLLYGETRTGKTRDALSVAKYPGIKKVYHIDIEHGWETALYATNPDGTPYFTPEDLAKIELIQIEDTQERPIASETILKFLSEKMPFFICEEHSKVNCKACIGKKETNVVVNPKEFGPDVAVIIDSGSQFGLSVANHFFGTEDKKDLRQYYYLIGRHLSNAMSMIQNARANMIVISHVYEDEIVLEKNKSGEAIRTRVDKYPLIGSANFSKNVGKYFGSIIHYSKSAAEFRKGSGNHYSPTVLTGTYYGLEVEKLGLDAKGKRIKEICMADVFEALDNIPIQLDESPKGGQAA